MSKRSHLSRWEDLKRGFVDIGRYRYMLRKINMEPWRDRSCPICNMVFTKEPNYKVMSYDIHTEQNPNSLGVVCSATDEFTAWWADLCAEMEEAY